MYDNIFLFRKRELKDLGVFVNILGGQPRMPSSAEIEVVVVRNLPYQFVKWDNLEYYAIQNMVSRCVEHIRDANTPYSSGTVGIGSAEGSSYNTELEQYAAQLLSLHKHITPASSSSSSGSEQQQPK